MKFLLQNHLDFLAFTYSIFSSLSLHSINVHFLLKIFSVLAVLTIIFLLFKKEIELKINFIHFSSRKLGKTNLTTLGAVGSLASIYTGGKKVLKDLNSGQQNSDSNTSSNGSSSNSNNGSNSNTESSTKSSTSSSSPVKIKQLVNMNKIFQLMETFIKNNVVYCFFPFTNLYSNIAP
uniref:Uncharacterized protein n=1 Tax=Amanita phalloides TaxID=67723 RepID=A0A5Q0N363_AMAPH|nr:hypothetical protein [Amanita phalloides]QFZ98659.1 hypothetical protein [Amanita phalloides]